MMIFKRALIEKYFVKTKVHNDAIWYIRLLYVMAGEMAGEMKTNQRQLDRKMFPPRSETKLEKRIKFFFSK